MGNITTGRRSDPQLIKKLIASTLGGARSQGELDKKVPAFKAALKKHQIAAQAAHKDVKPQIVWHERLGVVVDGYKFTFLDG